MVNGIFGLCFLLLSALQFLAFVTYYENPGSWVLYITALLTLGIGFKTMTQE